MKTVNLVARVLIGGGALNLGLDALLNFNLVSTLLGSGTMLEKYVYILVGVAAGLFIWDEWFATSKKKG